jgi:hypothetical protein
VRTDDPAKVFVSPDLLLRVAHGAAGLGAAPADLRALVFAPRFARFGAGFADFCASAASHAMQGRLPKHEVMAGIANLHAIQEEKDVMGIGMFSAFVQAIVNDSKADIAAILAIMDALVHLRRLIFVNVRHVGPFVCTLEPFPVTVSDVSASWRPGFAGKI